MSRTPAKLTQADVARCIRAAKREGADSVEVRVGADTTIVIKIAQSTGQAQAEEDIVL